MTRWRSLFSGLAALSLWLSGCGGASNAVGPPAPGPLTPEQEKIRRLLTEITDMTKPRGCAASKECRAEGLGYGGCGPRQYVVYCPRNVDEALLRQRLGELSELEQAEARRQGEAPPCRATPAPEAEAIEGACRAKLP